MVKVKVDMNKGLDKALKKFKKACNDAGVFKDIKRLQHYEKPSEKRRREKENRLRAISLSKRKGNVSR